MVVKKLRISRDKVLNCPHARVPGNPATIINDVIETFLCRSNERRWPLSLRIANAFGAMDIRVSWDDLVACRVFQIWTRDGCIVCQSESAMTAIDLVFEFLPDTACYNLSLVNREHNRQPRVHLVNTRREALQKAEHLLTLAIGSIGANTTD